MGRLDHFVQLGVNMIALSPIFPSEEANYGHEVTDFLSINPDFGTLDDYKSLCEAAKAKSKPLLRSCRYIFIHSSPLCADLKVILDFVPNHSSRKHNWFIKSAQNDPAYADYYVWKQNAGSVTWVHSI